MSLKGERLWQRCIEAVADEGRWFGVLARDLQAGALPARKGLDTQVPWIPAWTARDLVGHLGTVHRWATGIVRAGTTEPPASRPEPPDDGLLDWYAAGLSGLLAALRSTPPEAPAWHMSPAAEKVAASWARRQAHELAVHRMDLETAAGVPLTALDPELAEDGVDELLSIVVPRWAHTEPLRSAEATVGVVGTDTGREWSVRVIRGAVEVRTERDGAEDATLIAPVAALLLRLWGRPAGVTVTGDPAAEALLRGR
ncbi:MAG TPA: maleylpyruvate isomerase family mycothiol-dependent enzyme [Geodermatophilus sp.]|nr:maleylpyruvate isomerase family mycothiol-dependent enzyme [Geodermatophilus sp.]